MAVDMFGYVGKQQRGDSFLLDEATEAGPCFIRALRSEQKKAGPKSKYLTQTMREATQSDLKCRNGLFSFFRREKMFKTVEKLQTRHV